MANNADPENGTETVLFGKAAESLPVLSPVCTYCAHLKFDKPRSCAAFAKIPRAIWLGYNDHTKPMAGDNGITFQSVV